MNGLIWIHDVLANSGMVDKLLAGDSTLCAIVGVLLGCCLGQEHLKRTLDQDNG
jgi:hypothetical protein